MAAKANTQKIAHNYIISSCMVWTDIRFIRTEGKRFNDWKDPKISKIRINPVTNNIEFDQQDIRWDSSLLTSAIISSVSKGDKTIGYLQLTFGREKQKEFLSFTCQDEILHAFYVALNFISKKDEVDDPIVTEKKKIVDLIFQKDSETKKIFSNSSLPPVPSPPSNLPEELL